MNKILVNITIPVLEKSYDLWIPVNKKINNIIILIIKGIDNYNPKFLPKLYNKLTGENYDGDAIVQDTNIMNASELILI